ncbi:MAG: acyl-CoA desaturase [Actinobacteria bacterium]|nr:MAG: acyl-CoA desaturase [Actinomycetota bacterium]
MESVSRQTLPEPHYLLRRIVTAIGVSIPMIGVLIALGLFWGVAVRPVDLALLFVFYTLTGVGISVGYHRLFTHSAFQTSAAMRGALAILGSFALEGGVIGWACEHRKHHAYSDVEGDPHSPHVSGPGVKGKVKGLWHAHMGWFFSTKGMAETELRFRRDLDADPVLKTVDRLYFLWILLTLGIPFAVGYAVGGTLWLGFEAMVWGGLVRIFLGHHITWSINSICHMFGSRPYKARDESRNNFLLALPSFGESWHNNHHAFPASAIFGIDRGQLDLGALTIRLFERLGLVWNVNAPNESQRALRRASA